jgi:hypothetical protein
MNLATSQSVMQPATDPDLLNGGEEPTQKELWESQAHIFKGDFSMQNISKDPVIERHSYIQTIHSEDLTNAVQLENSRQCTFFYLIPSPSSFYPGERPGRVGSRPGLLQPPARGHEASKIHCFSQSSKNTILFKYQIS